MKGNGGNVAHHFPAMQWRQDGAQRRAPGPPRDYFDDADAEEVRGGSVRPAPVVTKAAPDDDDEVDPLDAFMAGITAQAKKDIETIGTTVRPEICGADETDDVPSRIEAGDSDDDVEEGPVGTEGSERKARVEPLPAVDHATVIYPKLVRHKFKPHPLVQAMTPEAVEAFLAEREIHIMGEAPRPITKLEHAGFGEKLLEAMHRLGYLEPTPIQSQAIPCILAGLDVLGLAKTGSGKTFAYAWPMLMHILAQPQMEVGDGPIALVLAPTRELAAQIYAEIKKFAKTYNIRVCAIYGGAGKYEMSKALKEAPECVVATPGRFIEMVRNKSTNLLRVTMVVLDEADRMFDMGFEYQMRSIVDNTRPTRQMVMFSATMKKRVERFAADLLKDYVRIVVGRIGQSNPDIRQQAVILPCDADRWPWLGDKIDSFASEGKVLVFVLHKTGCEELSLLLRQWFSRRQLDIAVGTLHGDKDQSDRSKVMHAFCKTSTLPILVATDIAARGLDVQDVRTVINYDAPKNIETYVHRIGRTGRMGVQGVHPGTAFTLLGPKDSAFAVDLVHNLRLSEQPVDAELLQLAQRDAKWHKVGHSRAMKGTGAGLGMGQRAMTSEMLANASVAQSRLAAAPVTAASRPAFPAANVGPGTKVRGFVRASTEYHSVSASVDTEPVPIPAQTDAVGVSERRKRSRWDT